MKEKTKWCKQIIEKKKAKKKKRNTRVRGRDSYIDNSDRKNYIYIYSKLLKLVDQFTYICSNISSTERDAYIHIRKMWSAIDSQLKFDFSDEIKQDFF